MEPITGAPLTNETVQLITDWANQLRKMITDEALRVSGFSRTAVQTSTEMTGEMLGVTGELAKAFDALNQAAVFINVAINHVDYAKEHYDRYIGEENNTKDSGA